MGYLVPKTENIGPNFRGNAQPYTLKDFDETTSPFSFNAGNVYHSLEYQHYELLQICARSEADELLSRVIHVVEQSVRKSGDSDAWFKASILTDGVFDIIILNRETSCF